MKNAHERFGFAEFEEKLRDTSTRIRLTADCFIGERAERSAPSAGHLLSAFGSDVELAALWVQALNRCPQMSSDVHKISVFPLATNVRNMR